MIACNCIASGFKRLLASTCLLIALSACQLPQSLKSSINEADQIALQKNLQKKQIQTKNFTLQSFHSHSIKDATTIHVYIEGDGRAWANRTKISTNPTPRDLTLLKLLLQDPSKQLIYLARPCQFVELLYEKNCSEKYWTSHRYSDEVIDSLDSALNQIKSHLKLNTETRLGLIGYSGGGQLAGLLAAKRKDIDWIITIAANLDHAAWTSLHNDSPLIGSKNMADIAQNIQHIPQIHYVGDKDSNVPLMIAESYQNKMDDLSKFKITSIRNYDHTCCWSDNWQQLLQQALTRFAELKDNKNGLLEFVN